MLSVLPSVSWAFQTGPRQLSPALLVSKREITRLNVGFSPDWNDEWNSEEDAMIIMSRAQICSESDSCSLEDAKLYLDNVLRIQSGCASGDLVGNAVCENVDRVAEVVANLREKIQLETKRLRYAAHAQIQTFTTLPFSRFSLYSLFMGFLSSFLAVY